AHPPKRSHTQYDSSSSSRAARSPLRGANQPHALLDPYSPQQSQYNSPPTNSYPYSPTSSEQQRPFPSAYQSHSRAQSQVKSEVVTPPMPGTAYSPSSALPATSIY
ncbi:hypothetical protein K474DRAFT_1579505, partial [Panus rudis PR-1116 ss-1]